MPSLKITQQIVASLLPQDGKDTIFWDTYLTGFGIKVTVSGERSYIVQARIQKGRNKRRVRLNECARMTVLEARREAKKLLANMGLGVDPVTERKTVEMAQMTLRKALEDRITTRKLKAHTVRDYRAIAARAFPDWMDAPLATISGQMAIERHRRLTEGGPVQANHAMRILSTAFGHARGVYGLQAPNPVTRIREGKLFNKVRPRDGFVELHELPVFLATLRRMELARLDKDRREQHAAREAGLSWRGMRSRLAQAASGRPYNGYTAHLHYAGAADIVRVLLLTGFRLEEVQGLRWKTVDLTQKVITLTDNKASRTLRMPMCEALYGLMKRRASELRQSDGKLPEWVFPTAGGGRYQSLSARVMPDLSRATAEALGKPFHVHAHKLRHTFATLLRAMGHSEWTVAALLNHSRTSSVTTLYAAPMTATMHQVVNEYQGYLERVLDGSRTTASLVASEMVCAAELLSGTFVDRLAADSMQRLSPTASGIRTESCTQ